MEHFCLRWNNFHRNMSSGFRALLLEDSLVDVTLAADGHFVQAHRLVLSVCSPYFKELFSVNPCNHPIVILKDVKYKQLTNILSFIYQGEVSVRQEDLSDFLKTAELLQIRGLAEQTPGKDNLPSNSEKHASSGCSVIRPSTRTVQVVRNIREKALSISKLISTDQAVSDNIHVAHEETMTEGTGDGAVGASGGSPLSSETCIVSEEASSMFLQIPIKRELPEVSGDGEQDIGMTESEEFLPRESCANEDHHSNGPVNSEELDVSETRLWAATSEDGASTPQPSNILVRDIKALVQDNLIGKKMPRKQRTIALNKIRRFLVTPKRSRRIAYARKMKQRKHVISRTTQNSDIVDYVSQFAAIGKPTVTHVKQCFDSSQTVKNDQLLPLRKKKTAFELPSNGGLIKTKENPSLAELVEEKVNTAGRVVKKVRRKTLTFAGSRKKRKILTLERQNNNCHAKKSLVNDSVNLNSEASTVLKDEEMKSEIQQTSEYNNTEMSIGNCNKSSANKKKMIVMIAAKKTKSAVALARKSKSSIILSDKTNSPEQISLPMSRQVRSPVRKKMSKPSTENQSTVETSTGSANLRSNASSSSFKDLTSSTLNGDSCRNTGCVGCREDN